MIAVSKIEKEIIAEQLPNAHIVRTMKQRSDRHHYYCEETQKVMELIEKMRSCATDQRVGTK